MGSRGALLTLQQVNKKAVLYHYTHERRNPEHHQRPSFGQICTYLQQPIDEPAYQIQYSEISIENFDKSCQSQYSVNTLENLYVNQTSNNDPDYDELVSNEAYGKVEWETKT